MNQTNRKNISSKRPHFTRQLPLWKVYIHTHKLQRPLTIVTALFIRLENCIEKYFYITSLVTNLVNAQPLIFQALFHDNFKISYSKYWNFYAFVRKVNTWGIPMRRTFCFPSNPQPDSSNPLPVDWWRSLRRSKVSKKTTMRNKCWKNGGKKYTSRNSERIMATRA